MRIIGFSGGKGVGKDTSAQALIDCYGFVKMSFANKLKEATATAFNIDRPKFEILEEKELIRVPSIILNQSNLTAFLDQIPSDLIPDGAYTKVIDKFDGFECPTYRVLLQVLGTDVGRKLIKDTIWLDLLKRDLDSSQENLIVFTDARFSNEREFLRGYRAKLIRVYRPGFESEGEHASENDLGDDSEYHTVVTNDTNIYKLHAELKLWYALSGCKWYVSR